MNAFAFLAAPEQQAANICIEGPLSPYHRWPARTLYLKPQKQVGPQETSVGGGQSSPVPKPVGAASPPLPPGLLRGCPTEGVCSLLFTQGACGNPGPTGSWCKSLSSHPCRQDVWFVGLPTSQLQSSFQGIRYMPVQNPAPACQICILSLYKYSSPKILSPPCSGLAETDFYYIKVRTLQCCPCDPLCAIMRQRRFKSGAQRNESLRRKLSHQSRESNGSLLCWARMVLHGKGVRELSMWLPLFLISDLY
jgi:hypothetical protein